MKFSCNHCGKRFVTDDELFVGRVYRIPCKCGNSIVLRVDASLCDRGTPVPCTPPRASPPLLPDPCSRGVSAQPSAAVVHRRSFASRPATEARSPTPSGRRAAAVEGAPPRPSVFAAPASRPVQPPRCERDSSPADVASVQDPFARDDAPEPAFASSREFTLVPGSDPATRGHGPVRRDPDASADDTDERTGPNWVPLEWARRTLRPRAFVGGVASGALVALLVVVGLAVAARPSASIVAVARSEPEKAIAAAVASPPPRPPRAARTRRAPSTPTGSDRTAIAASRDPRAQSAEPVKPEPDASTTKTAEPEGAAIPASHPGAVEPVDSKPAPASADAGEPRTEDAGTVANATGAAAASNESADQEHGAQREDAAKPEDVAHEETRDSPPDTVERVTADDRTGTEGPNGDAPTASATVPAQETIATANASR